MESNNRWVSKADQILLTYGWDRKPIRKIWGRINGDESGKTIANTVTFSYLFSLYLTMLLFIPAALTINYPKNPSSSLTDTGAEGLVSWVSIVHIILFILIMFLVTHYLFRNVEDLSFIGSPFGKKIFRAILIISIYILACSLFVVLDEGPWLYLLYASAQGFVLAIVYETFSIPLIPSKLKTHIQLERHVKNWWNLCEIFVSGILLMAVFTVPLVDSVLEFGVELLIIFGLPALGFGFAIIYTVIKQSHILSEMS